VLVWVREALQASHADQRREHQEAIERLRAEYKRLDDRIHTMYVDKLDGKIGGDFYDRFAGEWREEQRRLQREIDRHQQAEESYMDEGVQILELARNAKRLFERQEPREKRRLLNFVLSNCSWEGGEVIATFRQTTTQDHNKPTTGPWSSPPTRPRFAGKYPRSREPNGPPL
jgi:hypothetical protein